MYYGLAGDPYWVPKKVSGVGVSKTSWRGLSGWTSG